MMKFAYTKHVAVVLLAAGLLVGCQSGDKENTTSSSVQDQSVVASESASASAVSSEASPVSSDEKAEVSSSEAVSGAEESSKKEGQVLNDDQQQVLDSLFSQVSQLKEGVAGASLSAAKTVGNWFNEIGEKDFSVDQVVAGFRNFFQKAGSEAKEGFQHGWEMVKPFANELASRSKDALGMLKDAGINLNNKALNSDAWQKIQQGIDETLKK